MKNRVLLLNQGYQPLDTICWERAFCLMYLDKVDVITEYTDEYVHSIDQTFSVPAVIRLREYDKPAPSHTKFCRENVFLRDDHTCQYCGKPGNPRNLTFDHVQPRSKGGKTSWTNIVTACRPCNHRKGDRSLREVGMSLLNEPRVPSRHEIQRTLLGGRHVNIPQEWEMWIQ